MAGDGLARVALTSSHSISDNLALAGMAEWENSGICRLKQLLYQFQTAVQLDMNFGVDDAGVDVKFFGDTSGAYLLWDMSDDQLEFAESKMTMTTATETAANPGRQMYLQRTHTGTVGAGQGLTGVEVRSTFNGAAAAATSEVKGGEFKARHTAGNTFNVGTMKGVIGNVDSKSGAKTVTSAWAVEGQIDCGVSSTITTAAGCRVAYNEDGTVTNAYGIYVDGTSVWDIGVYCVGGKSVNAIQVGENGVSGGDVLFYSGTAGSSVLWDQSEDNLIVTMGSARAITGEDHCLDVVAAGTLASGESIVGLNVAVTTGGTAGLWASGIFAKVTQGTTKNVNGYISGAELEVVNTNVNASDWFPLVLNANSVDNGTHSSYIALRTYGTQELNSLMWVSTDFTIGTNDGTVLMSSGSDTAATHYVRFIAGATAYWVLATTTTPS